MPLSLLFLSLGALFLALAIWRLARSRAGAPPQAKACLILGAIFTGVGGWLRFASG